MPEKIVLYNPVKKKFLEEPSNVSKVMGVNEWTNGTGIQARKLCLKSLSSGFQQMK